MTAIPSKNALHYGNLIWDINQLYKFPDLIKQFREETAAGRDPYQVRDEILDKHPEVSYIYCLGHDIDHPDRIHHLTKSQSVNKPEALK